jgi:hypothetical protein
MQKTLHIIFKNTNCVDFIYPKFFVEQKESRIKIDYLIWDLSVFHLKKYLPKNLDFKTFSAWDFIDKKFNLHFLEKSFYTKRLYYFFLKKCNFLLHKQKLRDFLLGYDSVYLDCREFDYVPFVKSFVEILNSIKKTITFVPHGPHYRDKVRETCYDHVIFFSKLKKKLILSNKYSEPWLDVGGFKKDECIYQGFPARNKTWLEFIEKLKTENYDEKNIGFLFRPFNRNFNQTFLNFRKEDHYVNSYAENQSFIRIAKKLVNQGYKVIFRLHPSSKFDAFKKFYKKDLKNLEFEFSQNTVHDFYSKCQYVLSFNSSSLIYGCLYNKNVFLKINSLSEKVWNEWPGIDKIYKSFSNLFIDESDFFNKFNYKNSLLKFDNNKVLDKLW